MHVMRLDIHLNGAWHACAVTELLPRGPATRHGSVRLKYEADYAARHLGATDYGALTVRAPVDFGDRTLPHWPSFLIDLLPQGAARRRLERVVAAELNEWDLLLRGAINPVGNLRVRPAQEPVQQIHTGFRLEEMAARGDAF